MGGFGSGGHRSGAGRKKKAKHLRLIDGGADRRGGAGAGGGEPPDASTSAVPIEPPSWLTPAALDIWRDWAVDAHAAGTLTKTTRHIFGELCEVAASCRELYGRLQVTTDPASGQPRALLRMSTKEEMATRRLYLNLSKEMHLRAKDFRLAPFGKELAPSGAAPAADPLDAFMG